ncbi:MULTISPECIES: membrane protein insertase YidC [Auritidibacter]|uniref:Membrane protein insertase YidC n=1 Tax=Auritidibacter ignavus TaxID=678932 RepID=A0AAJ6AFW3_9MICC|nr:MULTISPECIES: membrane protein insertase YidC [Auritidibacter]AXR74489.1 membrane protein insertase YidC [Auritidibacter sp. NML130574]NIH72394.1 YidC/Oxa1 family membrane protein insertase [Auritidibacter ignavus]PXA80679.1 membrane protein insertase YidC [Auritidibacter sp. NML120636]RMX23391.1 membrane protein insertase YidC [Auritidibacter ignavus]WGH81011.1 membrane protein insertase YidC [Auritidibacter ignavus]
MGFFDVILFPFKWVVSWILSIFHSFLSFLGLGYDSGWTWTLAIVLLVITIRTLLLPLFVRQIKSQRAMQAMQPEIKKLQQKYKGKKDQLSRQAMAMEQQALFKEHGTSPFSACLPMLVQMPFFFALYQVLNGASHAAANGENIAALSHEEISSFARSSIFGAQMQDTFLGSTGENLDWSVIIVAAVMIVLMSSSMFYMQRMLMSKNMTEAAMTGPFAQSQKLMLYVLPLVFAIGGINFPIGVLVYWTATNFWAVGQQFYIIRRNPAPGSQAERELNERRVAKGLEPIGKAAEEARAKAEAKANKPKGQRQQPVRKSRKKR